MQDFGYEYAKLLYYTPAQLDKSASFWPVRAGMSIAKPGYRVGPKRIECYSLHFVRKGHITLLHSGKSSRLSAGDAFVLYPKQTYSYYKPDHVPELEMCWLAFDGPDCLHMLERIGMTRSKPILSQCWTPPLQESLDAMFERMQSPSELVVSLEMQSYMYKMFAELIKKTARLQTPLPAEWLRKSVAYMELHATEGITVQQVSEKAGVNRTYFSSQFAKHYGMTPMAYLTAIRMKKANQLLAETSASITEIAYSLGYANLYAFTRAYSNYYAMSPTAYRKHCRKNHRKDHFESNHLLAEGGDMYATD